MVQRSEFDDEMTEKLFNRWVPPETWIEANEWGLAHGRTRE